MNFSKNQKQSYINLSNCIRVLAADSVEKARSGHPGLPLGMADVMTILAFEFLKFNPNDPKWHGRDRLVLSAGHGSMLLYAFYYLTGYKNFTLEDLKNFRQLGSKTPGHPEYGIYEAIETTTGPLGQGLANSVGMAIAAKKYQTHLGDNISDYKIYCIVGDGCLMEGIGYEATSLAGHLQLNNLVILFDDNQISIDGKTDLSVSEDQLAKFSAQGFCVERVDGHDFEEIRGALTRAQQSETPYFIAFRTTIGKGVLAKAGSEESHGSPLGTTEIKYLKDKAGFLAEPFWLPNDLLSIWRQAWLKTEQEYLNWQEAFSNLSPEQKEYLIPRTQINTDFLNYIQPSGKPEATRVSSGRVIEDLMQNCNRVICGSADLSTSNNIKNLHSKAIRRNDFSGNFIHYGVREHAMAGIMNGLALSGFLPLGGTFFVFSDYMKPAIRLSAIMHQQIIYIMTHDSIGVGEDGPTHQPIEQLAGMRAMPNLLVMRPMDQMETKECWELALKNTTGPSMLVLTRQNAPQVRQEQGEENLCSKGAYVICNTIEEADVLIFASGSEVSIALEVSKLLNNEIVACVISVPSFTLFFQQEPNYIAKLLDNNKMKVAIEAGSSFGWHRIIGNDGIFFGIDEFGTSAPASEIYKHLGLQATDIARKIRVSFRPRPTSVRNNRR